MSRRPDKARVRSILDLGTGTGCLLLAALTEYRHAYGVGVDLSPDAATLALANARRNALFTRAGFLAGNWFSALSGQFDVIVSNPPYIRVGDLAGLCRKCVTTNRRVRLLPEKTGLMPTGLLSLRPRLILPRKDC